MRMAFLALLAALPLAGCSVAWHRLDAEVQTGDRRYLADLYVRASYVEQSLTVWTDSILFPLDGLFSLFACLQATADDDIRIGGGPLGAVTSVLLPFVTATWDPEIDTLEEMRAGRSMPGMAHQVVLLPLPRDQYERWRRGDLDLAAAFATSLPDVWLANGFRRGDVVVELRDRPPIVR